MSKKRLKTNLSILGVGGDKWETDLASVVYNDDKWKTCIAVIIPRKCEDVSYEEGIINSIENRKNFSFINKENLLSLCKEYSQSKSKKGSKESFQYTEICDYVKNFTDKDMQVPSKYMALLIKFKLLIMKQSDLAKTTPEKSKGSKDKGKKQSKTQGKKGGKGDKKDEGNLDFKPESKLKKRKDEYLDKVYIDDEVNDKLNKYIFLLGFHDIKIVKKLASILICPDIIIQIHSQNYESFSSTYLSLERHKLTHESTLDEKVKHQMEQKFIEFEKIRNELENFDEMANYYLDLPANLEQLSNLIIVKHTFTKDFIDFSEMDENNVQTFTPNGEYICDVLANIVYSHKKNVRQWKTYLDHLHLYLPTEEIPEANKEFTPETSKNNTVELANYTLYNKILNVLPNEIIHDNIALILYAAVEQVERNESLEENVVVEEITKKNQVYQKNKNQQSGKQIENTKTTKNNNQSILKMLKPDLDMSIAKSNINKILRECILKLSIPTNDKKALIEEIDGFNADWILKSEHIDSKYDKVSTVEWKDDVYQINAKLELNHDKIKNVQIENEKVVEGREYMDIIDDENKWEYIWKCIDSNPLSAMKHVFELYYRAIMSNVISGTVQEPYTSKQDLVVALNQLLQECTHNDIKFDTDFIKWINTQLSFENLNNTHMKIQLDEILNFKSNSVQSDQYKSTNSSKSNNSNEGPKDAKNSDNSNSFNKSYLSNKQNKSENSSATSNIIYEPLYNENIADKYKEINLKPTCYNSYETKMIWDYPYPFYYGQLEACENSFDQNLLITTNDLFEKLNLLYHNCIYEFMSKDVVKQELFNATQKNEKVVAYYNKSCDQLNLLIYKKGTDLKINDSFDIYEETWNRYLFSNVGFRWYIKCIAPIIADWSNKQEVLYQHLFQRKSTITSEILSSKNTPIKKKPQKNERKSSAKSNRSTKSTDSAQSFEMFYQKKSELKWSKVEQPKEVENTKKETKKSKNIKETKSSKDVKSPNISGYDMQQEIFTKAQPKEFFGYNLGNILPYVGGKESIINCYDGTEICVNVYKYTQGKCQVSCKVERHNYIYNCHSIPKNKEGEFLGFNFNLTLPSKMFISVNRSNKNSNLNIACPNGLCVKFYCVDPINPKKMYISQQINNNTKREKDVKFETKRLFINNGDVIIMYNDDSIKIYHRSGEIDCLSRKNNVLIEKKLDFTNQKMSSIITDENETLAESSRVSHDPHGETDEGTKSENPKIMEINFIYQYYNIETIHVDGSIHYNYECNEEDFNFKDRTKLNTRLSMDPHTNQTMLIREDAFTHVRINEHSTVSEFSDGTRITNFTGKDPNKDKYMKHQKCSLFSNRNTDDSFVLIESPSFASILYDIDNGHSMAYFFDGTMINSYDINTHEFYTLDLTHFTFNLSYGLISVFSESNKIDQPNVNPIDSENYCSDDTKKYIKENHITNLSYVFTLKNDNDDVSKIPLFETGVDENTKTYTVTQKGELLVKNVMNPQSIDTSLRKSEKYKDWTDPRLIVINNDGSGVEIHSYAAIKNFITEASRDSQSVVVVDELKTKNINDINVFVPFYKKTTTWKHQYVMDSIIPHGLQSKNFREMKRFYLHGEEEPTEMKENIYFRNYEPDPLNSVSLVRRFRKYPVDNEDYKYSIYEAIKKMAANELKKWEVYHEVDVLNEKESMLKSKLAYINNMVYECCGNALNESIEREKLCIVKIENKPGDVCKINEDKKDDLTYLLEKQSINNYEIQSNPGTHSYINNEKTDLLTFDKELKDTKNLLMPTSRQIRISSLPDENWVPSSLSNDPTYYLKRKSMEMSSIQKGSGIIEESEVTDTTTINKPVSMKKVNIKSGGVKLPPIEKMQFKHSKRNVKLPACLKIGLCDDTKLERINNFSSKKTVKNISTIKLKNDMIQGRLRLFPKSTHFGTICEGYTYVSNVWLINTGNDTIRFKIVQPSNFKNDLQSISSLQVKYKPGPIAAGLRRELKLIYHAVAIGMDCQDLIEANFEVEIISENEKFLLPVKANIMSNTQFLKRQKYLKGIEDDLTSIHNNKSNNLKIWSKNTDELDGLSSPKKLNYNENLFINGNCPNRLSLI